MLARLYPLSYNWSWLYFATNNKDVLLAKKFNIRINDYWKRSLPFE